MSKKILITGGFGNLGSWLSEYFYKQGYEVFILAKKIRELKNIKYNVIQADITDYKQLKEKLDMEFDYCIHTASFNEYFLENYPKDALLINSLGTRNLIEILSNTKLKKFIYFSTFHIYGSNYEYITEENKPNPNNDYATTHLFAEYYLKQFFNNNKFPYITCRLTNSYGAPKYIDSTKWYLVLNDLVKSAYENKKIVLKTNGQVSRDFISMHDVCEVTSKLLDIKEIDEIFNISSKQNFEIIELANIVKKVYNQRYQNDIEISTNNNDTTVYKKTVVENKKLLENIDYKFSNNIELEVNKIFDLLEKK